MFDELWIKDEWYSMGYDYHALYRSMTKSDVEKKYKEFKDV